MFGQHDPSKCYLKTEESAMIEKHGGIISNAAGSFGFDHLLRQDLPEDGSFARAPPILKRIPVRESGNPCRCEDEQHSLLVFSSRKRRNNASSLMLSFGENGQARCPFTYTQSNGLSWRASVPYMR